MAITAQTRTDLVQLVVSMFGEAPSNAMLTDLVTKVNAGSTVQELADSLATDAAFTSQFPVWMTSKEFTTKIVNNMFAGGTVTQANTDAAIDYIAGAITAGTFTKTSAVVALTSYMASADALANDAYGSVSQSYQNKVEVAEYYTITKGLGDATAAERKAAIAGVTSAASSVTAEKASVDTAAVAVTAPAGQVFTLTTGVNKFTGAAGDDTFTADNTGTDVTSTADILKGGEGSDVLDLFSDGAAAALPAFSSIETLNVYDQDANITLSATAQSGVETLNIYRGDGALTYNIGATTTNVNLTDVVLAAGGVVIAAPATTTALTIGTSAVSAAGGAVNENIDINGTKVASVVLNANTTTAADVLDVAAAASLTINAGAKTTIGGITTTSTVGAITITGSGATSIGVIDNGVDSIIATTNTGGLTLTSPADNSGGVYVLSAGNDNFTTDDDGFTAVQTFSVDAGAGTGDILTVAAGADISTADEGGRYKNFEIIRTNDSVDMSRVAGITSLQLSGGTSKAYTNMTAEQAGSVTWLADNTTTTQFALKTATGKTDAITFNLASPTATTNINLAALDVDNFEEVTFNVLTGTNTTGDSALSFAANKADEVKSITINGSADTTLAVGANVLDVVPVNISAAGMTGTADFTLTTAVLLSGSSVTGSLGGDTITVSTTTGSTYDGGAGNDTFNSAVASLVATGSNDNKIEGGLGTDTLAVSTAAATLTDNHFTFVTGMEKMTTSTGNTAITTGGSFNAAFADSYTLTTGTLADTSTFNLQAGLYSKNVTVTIDGTSLLANAAGEDVTVVTSGGDDKITLTGTAWVGAAADSGTITITSGAGADTISYSHGTLLATTTSKNAVITAGTGADKITKVGTNSTTATSVSEFVIASGDSNLDGMDQITGFDKSDGTNLSDALNFAGTAAIGTLGTTVDFGTVLSHSITAGVATFDDAANFSAAIKINASNLSDVAGYLAANTATNDTVAFEYDANADTVNDATIVFNNQAVDQFVMLIGVTGGDALVTTNAAGANDIFIA